MLERAVVLDVNVLRNEAIVDACIERFERTGEPIAVPEMALFELTKHPQQWEATVKGSLGRISRCPEAVVVTRSSKPLGLAEEASGIPTRFMVDDAQSKILRQVLRDLQRGGGPDLDRMVDKMRQYRPQLEHERHATDSLRAMQTLKSIARPAFPPELMRRISTDLTKGSRTSFRDLLRAALQFNAQRDAHVRRGVLPQHAEALMTAPSVSYLFALATGVLGLRWTFEGGVDSAKPTRTANDVLDIEYVLAAFWLGHLVTRDARARVYIADLTAVASVWWPNHTSWFERVTVDEPSQALARLCPPRSQ